MGGRKDLACDSAPPQEGLRQAVARGFDSLMARRCLILALSVLALSGTPRVARAQTVDSTLWCLEPGGRVFAIAREGNTIYIGGNFASVGPASGGGVPVDIRLGTPVPRYPKVAGKVNVVVPDGNGGWYIGGLFAAVGGQPRTNLAHINTGGTIDAWAPNPNGEVIALALEGRVLYAGGEFDSVGGQERHHIAAFSTQSDLPLGWKPDANDRVSTLLVNGPVVYVGGRFTAIGGQIRGYVAAVDGTTGQATPWDASVDAEVLALALHDTTLFLGGYFANVRGTPRRFLAAVRTATGTLLPWDAAISRRPDFIFDGGPRVSGLLVKQNVLYVTGSFKIIGGQSRQGLAAVDISTAQATSWNPRAVFDFVTGAYFRAIASSGDTVFVAGQCDSLGGLPGSYLAALSAETAERFNWDPRPNWEVFALAAGGSTLYAGGGFTSIGAWAKRHDLAAIDATTGQVTDWAPEPDYIVQAIVVRGGTVYVGGSFSLVGGQPRSGIAALDATTGNATFWNPAASGTVYSLALWGSSVLAGGWFGSIGGLPRNNIAALDTATGMVTPWNPDANDIVYSIAPGDSVVYVGGWFSSIGGQPRASLAAIDPVTGIATPWAPSTDGIVRKIAVLRGTTYVGGDFNFVNGLQRDGIAAIDAAGMPTTWVANASRQILALAASDSTVYAGGGFSAIGGQPRFCIAALDVRTGAVRDWYPAPDGVVWSVAVSDGVVYAGGAFSRMGNWPQASFAAITPADAPAPAPRTTVALDLSQNTPNPTRQSTVVRYSLPSDADVSLAVFDLLGRRVATILSHASQMAGPHQVLVSTDGWRSGCYLYRLEAAGLSATRKMVVVK